MGAQRNECQDFVLPLCLFQWVVKDKVKEQSIGFPFVFDFGFDFGFLLGFLLGAEDKVQV